MTPKYFLSSKGGNEAVGGDGGCPDGQVGGGEGGCERRDEGRACQQGHLEEGGGDNAHDSGAGCPYFPLHVSLRPYQFSFPTLFLFLVSFSPPSTFSLPRWCPSCPLSSSPSSRTSGTTTAGSGVTGTLRARSSTFEMMKMSSNQTPQNEFFFKGRVTVVL